jgi:hypothetical protein
MKFLIPNEARAWCRGAGIASEDAAAHWPNVRCVLPAASARAAWFAGYLVASIPGVGQRLLWPKAWGIWPSSENWTLIERLRAGYGEMRNFKDAPAVVAEASEIDDLASFVQIGLISGWDLQLFGTQDMLRVWISHDEWVEFRAEDFGIIDQLRAELTGADIEILA